MASGVQVNAECQVAFQQLSEGKKLRYIIYKIDDDKQVANQFIHEAYSQKFRSI